MKTILRIPLLRYTIASLIFFIDIWTVPFLWYVLRPEDLFIWWGFPLFFTLIVIFVGGVTLAVFIACD